jgi:hypothetical protein
LDLALRLFRRQPSCLDPENVIGTLYQVIEDWLEEPSDPVVDSYI